MNDFWHIFRETSTIVSQLTKLALVFVVLLFACGVDQPLAAQDFAIPAGVTLSPEQMKKMKEMRAKMRSKHGQKKPPEAKKSEEKKSKKDEKKDDEKKKDEGVKTVKRPTDDSTKLDPDRMRLTPDKNGLVQFNYNGHPWAEVLQEFADAAKFSFDWQELPADKLNLVTQKKYNLLQARGLLNRHLLARGFTLIVQGEVLTAVKIEKLDPSLVPRVEADELEDYPPYDFVRVRFQLPQSMDPTKAMEDVKVLLSPNAKVTPLLNTKRLLVIDSVVNLRSVRDLIYAEQSAADAIVTPEVYKIKYRRATYVAEQVMIVLGLDPSSRKEPQELQLETQRMQLYMQMQKKGKDVSKLLKKSELPVYFAVDKQENTILINAPQKLLPVIERTIRTFDVPRGSSFDGDLGGLTTKPHKTTTASTDAVVSALTEFGQLNPLTRLQSDLKTKTIFAYATEADHQKIEQMITKLDSKGRKISVIWLRRLPVRQVAGTLMSLLVGEEKKEETGRRSFFRFGGSNEEKKEVGFKAKADVENNRLILWANEDELTEVRGMLAQLGETPEGGDRNTSKVRELRARSPAETARLLERLKAAYPGKLNIDDSANQSKHKQSKPEVQGEDKVTQRSPLSSERFLTAQHTTPSPGKPDEMATVAPEVNIVVTEDGRIVISGDDPNALNDLEDLVNRWEPPQQDFHQFSLKHAEADNVVSKLELYFAEELKGQTESVFDAFGQFEGTKEKKMGRASLGSRQMLRFLDDDYTNSVIVQGASPSQLEAIEKIIQVYDQPPKPELNYYTRKTIVIPMIYSRATDIAKSLKEVYRELLSSKDKEFQDKEGKLPLGSRANPYAFGKAKRNVQGEEVPVFIYFEGVLSIGVDNVSNSLIISARQGVLEDIEDTVRLLDQAAAPNTMVHIHRIGGGLSAPEMQKMLKDSFGQPWSGGKPQQAAAKSRGGDGNRRSRNNQNNQRNGR